MLVIPITLEFTVDTTSGRVYHLVYHVISNKWKVSVAGGPEPKDTRFLDVDVIPTKPRRLRKVKEAMRKELRVPAADNLMMGTCAKYHYVVEDGCRAYLGEATVPFEHLGIINKPGSYLLSEDCFGNAEHVWLGSPWRFPDEKPKIGVDVMVSIHNWCCRIYGPHSLNVVSHPVALSLISEQLVGKRMCDISIEYAFHTYNGSIIYAATTAKYHGMWDGYKFLGARDVANELRIKTRWNYASPDKLAGSYFHCHPRMDKSRIVSQDFGLCRYGSYREVALFRDEILRQTLLDFGDDGFL